jgi:DNA repair protein RecN (Recombination protein N)
MSPNSILKPQVKFSMIKSLTLHNLVLVDSCTLSFTSGFTALTGETGAGKTALIEAISLALGARADTSLIRKGADKASIEITFDISSLPILYPLLQEAGITHDPLDELIIRREISKEGKNRTFINSHMTQLPLLQKIGNALLELVGQHSHQALYSSEFPRNTVDLFGDTAEDLILFQKALSIEKDLQRQLDLLLSKQAQKESQGDLLRMQVSEIETAHIKEGEEEAIIAEHRRLAHSQEIASKIEGLLEILSSTLPHIGRSAKICESLIPIDQELQPPQALLQEAAIALSEARHELQSYQDQLENNPARFAFLEERLAILHKLKRKYAPTISQIQELHIDLKQQLSLLENLTDEIGKAQDALTQSAHATSTLALALTEKRKCAAKKLSQELTLHIRALNMPGAEIDIAIKPQPRTLHGDDEIQFWMRANTGEHPILVKDHASGGELSRLLFAIKLTLAEKNGTPTLFFDEIDSNVGGTTASIIGEKLRILGKSRQVICITHFHQVASQADHHIGVQKIEQEGRTLTVIRELHPHEKEAELLRMLGGKKPLELFKI